MRLCCEIHALLLTSVKFGNLVGKPTPPGPRPRPPHGPAGTTTRHLYA